MISFEGSHMVRRFNASLWSMKFPMIDRKSRPTSLIYLRKASWCKGMHCGAQWHQHLH